MALAHAHKVEIQPTIDLVEYGGLWPACGGGKSGGYRRDDGCGFLSPSPIGFHYHREHTQPSSEHLRLLAWCFLASVAWAAAVADTPASNKVTGLSGEVMLTSNAAVLPKNQLGSKMSAGRVLLWSLLRLLPTSTLTPMCARRQVSTRMSLILLWRETTSPPYLQVTAWWPR